MIVNLRVVFRKRRGYDKGFKNINLRVVSQAVVPERFDIFLSSHQLWHICIVFAVYTWYHGIIEYHGILHTQGCHVFDE
jgi:hypothetical protein